MKIIGIKIQAKQFSLTTVLQLTTLVIGISLFLKAIIDVDKSYDAWLYHIPFAARLWQIIPAEQHIFFDDEASRFAGFPLLVEYLQGFLWFFTRHLQSVNLIDFFSFFLYCFFLKAYFQVPFYSSVIALLAIPLVQIHATSSYVDLPSNLCLSTLILMTYLLYVRESREVDNKRNLILIFLVAIAAANIKFQFVPIAFLVLGFSLLRIIWLRWQQIKRGEKTYQWLQTCIPLVFLGTLLIFATPIKNVALYGNPFYPIKIEIAGKVLNHQLGFYQHAADSIKYVPKAQRWLYSILEVKSPKWTIDQWSPDPENSRIGGFFGAYVVFNLLLLAYLFWQNRCRETQVAITLLGIMSAVTAIMPQSHELRYYMYWMITLVSLNLLLLSHIQRLPQNPKILNFRNLGIICLAFLVLVVVKTNFSYITPNFYTLDKHIQTFVDPAILKQIQPGDKVCLVNKSKQYRKTPLYASYFHSQLGYSYSIKSALHPSECRESERIIDVY